MGAAAEAVFKPGAMANAESVAWFVDFAARRAPISQSGSSVK